MNQKKADEKWPHEAKVVEPTTPDEMVASQVEQAERQLETIALLNSTADPIEAKIWTPTGRTWEYNNNAWREMVIRMHETGQEQLEKFIIENKK